MRIQRTLLRVDYLIKGIMIEISKNLFIGNISDYYSRANDNDFVFVHATQTIHYQLMGWDRKFNKPNKLHPNYIKYKDEKRFSLNWVDGVASLYDWTKVETFIEILDFIDSSIKSGKKVLVHCDQGQSRSPTVGLLYMAFRSNEIPKESFVLAEREFRKIYPFYNPSGIADYVNMHWAEFA